jgi:putative transcriptional regulator
MISPKTGALLIADPFLQDPNFKRSVVFLCEHLPEGSFGLVLNKDLNISLGELIDDLEGNATKVYFGGPVQMDTIHFLHQMPNLIPNASKVGEDIYWGGDFAMVIQLIKKDRLDMQKIRFFLGYSGWEKGQLKKEMTEVIPWLTAMANANLVFHNNANNIWGDALSTLGNDYAPLKNYPIDPRLN